ncbi:MAG: hypothetical protein GEU81_11845 [Nitriliruptorales bacterium]|nr:hypothetical protein [Nitriliruptorales bacterium]
MASSVIPVPIYDDARRAIEFLVDAFGFERHAVYEDEDGTIAHVELTFDGGMLMIGSATEGELADFGTTVHEAGKPTSWLYVVVEAVDAHCERARAAGAEIVMELRDKDYGGRDYTCRDFEGHLWTFGSYDPWATTGA